MTFKNENVAAGLAEKASFQVGSSDVDPRQTIEGRVTVPWASNKEASWVYYDCTVGVMLDSGIVVHNRLPQVNNAADTLGSCDLDNSNIDAIVGPGVNLKCEDQYRDIVQRMGHARYWFRLWGQALRIGYRVPIPSLKIAGGVPAIPYDKNPQWAYNRILPNGNYGGVPLWHAAWSLWYTTTVPPTNSQPLPAVDLAAHISGSDTVPSGVQVPYSLPDDDAMASRPGTGRRGPPLR